MSIGKEVEKLAQESVQAQAEAERLTRLGARFPDLKKYTGRWGKVVYCSKETNAHVTRFDSRHNCGCCSDSPLEVWPYMETPDGHVYSDPPMFFVGNRDPMTYGDIANPGWDRGMREAGIPQSVISDVEKLFTPVEESDEP